MGRMGLRLRDDMLILNTLRSAFGIVLTVGVAAGVFSESAEAQSERVAVTVVLTAAPVYGAADVVIIRRAMGENLPGAKRDVIVVKDVGNATIQQLSNAVLHLLELRRRHGDESGSNMVLRVRPEADARAPLAGRPLPWVERVVNDLRIRSEQEMGDLGAVKAIDIWLPAQRAP